jgi:protein-S-isoprenylcysteine O-methyltransferase Ste14
MSSGNKSTVVAWRGVVMAGLFVALWFWLAALVTRFDPAIGVSPPAWLAPFGWVIALAGAAVGLSCVVLFVTEGLGTPAPFDPPRVFVASGPYRYVRNPMYVGAVLALAGGGLAARSVSVVALGAVFWPLSHTLVVLVEEPDLAKRFGDSYAQYTRHVNRWVPRVPKSAPERAA